MKRVLAVGGAALLIVIAVLIRGALDDDGGGDRVDTDDDDHEPTELVVACIPELADACESLEGVSELRIEDPDDTIADADGIDAWVTLDPWPAIAAQGNAPTQLTGDVSPAAVTPLLLLVRSSAVGDCNDWACAVDTDRAALPPSSSAFGRLALGHAAAEWSAVTRPGEPFAAQEFSLPEFQRWLDAIDFVADPVDDMLVLGNAGPQATAVTAATYELVVGFSPRSTGLDASSGPLRATVAAVVTGPAADTLRQPLQDALVGIGWEPADADARSEGMPSAGVLFALAQEVS